MLIIRALFLIGAGFFMPGKYNLQTSICISYGRSVLNGHNGAVMNIRLPLSGPLL